MFPFLPSPSLTLGRIVLLTLAALALVGCESMSAPECKVADWNRVGLAAGAGGGRDRRITDHSENLAHGGRTPGLRPEVAGDLSLIGRSS